MIRKLKDPTLDIANANIFGLTPDVFKKAPMKYQMPVMNPEWRHRDTTRMFLRPLNEWTRREMAAIRELIAFPDNQEDTFKKHAIIQEDLEALKYLNDKRDEMME